MANLNLPDDQMREIVSAAILQTVTTENRDALIAQAIANLLAPNSSGYGRKESPLQEAFNSAVFNKAKQIVVEALDLDETLNTKIKAIVIEAAEKALSEEKRGEMINSMASAIAAAFRS